MEHHEQISYGMYAKRTESGGCTGRMVRWNIKKKCVGWMCERIVRTIINKMLDL